jgi:hypothetical protein
MFIYVYICIYLFMHVYINAYMHVYVYRYEYTYIYTYICIYIYIGKRRRNLGEVNSYYSESKVCERCYSVYRDIDCKRRLYKNRQFASQSDSSLDIRTVEEKSREFERYKHI